MTETIDKVKETTNKEPSSAQQFLLYNDVIPKKIINCTQEALIKIGFVFN